MDILGDENLSEYEKKEARGALFKHLKENDYKDKIEEIIKLCFSNNPINNYIEGNLEQNDYKDYKEYSIKNIMNLLSEYRKEKNDENFLLLKSLIKPYYLEYKLNPLSYFNYFRIASFGPYYLRNSKYKIYKK